MEKVGIGVIGCGGIAQSCHLPAYASLSDLCTLIAVADVDEERAREAGHKFGARHVFTDYRKLLELPEVHAVSIATPNAFHKQPTIDALLSGKHVLVEKPMALNAQECWEMVQAQRKSGKILQVALQWRFSGEAQFLRQFIGNGMMGEIYYARAWALRRRGVPGWGVFIDKEKQGGGPLIDIGVHILDFILHLLGYPKPLRVSGKTYQKMGANPKYYNAWGDYDRSRFTVEDYALGFVRFEGDLSLSLETSFMANLGKETFGGLILGTDAGAELDLFSDDPITIYTEFHQQVFDMKPRNIPKVKSPHTEEVRAFLHAILHNAPSPVPGEEGMILAGIIDALYRSAETGREEEVILPSEI
jgi:predicted dehydrogenase